MTVIGPCEWCGERAFSAIETATGRHACCPACRPGLLAQAPEARNSTRRQQTINYDMPGVAPGNALYGEEAA